MADIDLYRGDTYIEQFTVRQTKVQVISIEGTPTGGSFTLAYKGSTTDAISFDSTALQVQSRLESIPTIFPGDVTVAGGPGPATAWTATFADYPRGGAAELLVASSSFVGGNGALAVVRGQVYDLTGATLFWTLKADESQSDVDAAIRHTSGVTGGIAVPAPATGVAVHTITAAQSGGLNAGQIYKWDVQLLAADASVTTLRQGTLKVIADITQGTTA